MKVTFVVPVFNTDYRILRICINSILHAAANQHEVVIIDDASTNAETIDFLSRCEQSQSQNITILKNLENSGVSYSLNKGIVSANGDYIAPIDHDDLVIPSGFEVAVKHILYYGSQWVYTDELQVDTKGYLIRSLHKPAYSKQLLRSIMYINHLQIFSKSLVESIGGYRDGLEGSQDHDLALRMTELHDPLHVPSFAYQWRIMKETQSRRDWKVTEESVASSIRALSDHYHSIGHTAVIEAVKDGLSVYKSRIKSSGSPSFSIIIPTKLGTTRNVSGVTISLLENCLESIRDTAYTSGATNNPQYSFECILVINEDDDQIVGDQLLKQFELNGKTINDSGQFNFSRKCNLGATHSSGDILVFLNDDTKFLTKNWLEDVASLLTEEDVACLGGMLLHPDSTVQSCGDNIGLNSAVHYDPHPDPMKEGDPMHRYWADHETTSVTGAFFCCRKQLFLDLEGFKEVFSNSFQDVDFCLRARAQKLRCLISPHIKIIHYESSSRNPEVDIETLEALRSFHLRLISGKDGYQLWAYQPVRVNWLTPTGIIHKIAQIRNMMYLLLRSIRRLSPFPRERFEPMIK